MIVTIDRVISRSDENAGASPRNKFMPQYSWDGGRELSANEDRMPQAYLDFSARRHPGARTDHYVGTGTRDATWRSAQVDFAQFQLQFTDEPTITRIVWLFSFVLGFSRTRICRRFCVVTWRPSRRSAASL